jgi:serine/threonine-protein kinase
LTIVLQRLLVMAALVAVFFLSAGVVMYFALRGREVAVPNVVGKSQQDAESLLEEKGLKMRIRPPIPDNKEHATISEQSPAPGTTVKTGQSVRVSLSLGAPASSEKNSGAH